MEVSCLRVAARSVSECGCKAAETFAQGIWSGGRPRRIGEWVRERIYLIARTTPSEWGITGFSTWSLAKRAEHLMRIGLVASLSRQRLARILKAGGVSWQTATTWKSSNDPDFIAKMQ